MTRSIFFKRTAARLIVALAMFSLGTLQAYADTAWTNRIGGDDRIETAVDISRHMYPDNVELLDSNTENPIGPNYVIIARSDLFPDALAGAGLVTDIGTITLPGAEPVEEDVPLANPILLTKPDGLDDRVRDEIERLRDLGRGTNGQNPGLSGARSTEETGTKIYILGDDGAISENVVEDLVKIDGIDKDDITRVGGRDRYETAAMIDDEMAPGSAFGHENGLMRAIVATGQLFPDALSASGYAASFRVPILLTKKDELPDDTADALDSGDLDEIIIVGGTGAISNGVREQLEDYSDEVSRSGGDDRYETAVMFAEDVWGVDENNSGPSQRFVFSRGDDFPDALSGAGLVANESRGIMGPINAQSPIDPEAIPTLLTTTSTLSSVTEDLLDDLFDDNEVEAGNRSFVLGETGAISANTEEDIAEALSSGQFDPSNDAPEILDTLVVITPNGGDNDIAESDEDDGVAFAVIVDEHIKNEDSSFGEVTVDTTPLGEDNSQLYSDKYELTLVENTVCEQLGGSISADEFCYVSQGQQNIGPQKVSIPVGKIGNSADDNESVRFDVRAVSQGGDDTVETEEIEIEN